MKSGLGKHSILRALAAASAAAALVAALSGCSLFPQEEEELPPPLVEVKTVNYLTRHPSRGFIEKAVKGTATVEALNRADVYFDTNSGIIAELCFEGGDYVNAGDVLCRLDNREIDENLRVQEMQYEISQLEYQAAEEKYGKGELDEISWKKACLTYYVATKNIESLRAQYEATVLVAPISGMITFRADVKAGASVDKYQVLFTICDTSTLLVRFSGSDYTELGMNFTVNLTYQNGSEEETTTGTVIQTPDSVPDSDNNTDRYSVLIKPDETMPDYVKIGTTMQLYYQIAHNDDAIFIQKSAVKTTGTRKYVYLLVDGYRHEQDVETGIDGGYDIEITKGLTEDDEVIY